MTVRQHLGSLAPMQDDGFTALNAAFLQDVSVVRIPDGSDEPIAVCVNHNGWGRSLGRMMISGTLATRERSSSPDATPTSPS